MFGVRLVLGRYGEEEMKRFYWILFGACLWVVSTLGVCEIEKPNFKLMSPVDHAGKVYSDGTKFFLVVFENYYKKEPKFILEVERPKNGYSFVSGQCHLKGVYDQSITALVKIDSNKAKWSDTLNAWKIDKIASEFIPVNSIQVTCDNDAWGV